MDLFFSIENVDGNQTVFCEKDGDVNRPITFREYLQIRESIADEPLILGSSSIEVPDEYGKPTADSEAILTFLGGAGLIRLRSNSAVQQVIQNDRELIVKVLGEDLVKHITADAAPVRVEVAAVVPELKHDDTRWRFHRETSVDGYSQQWVMESDEYKAMAIMTLPHLSKWHKDNNPGWEKEWNADVDRLQANADLIQSSPIMLRALLAAQAGDYSQIQNAIDHATGKLDWLGNSKAGAVL